MTMALRVLITNAHLQYYAGSEVMVRNLALELKRLGHEPTVYSPKLGTIAREIESAGVRVAGHLDDLPAVPDIIHGHHHPQVLEALFQFSAVPAILSCLAATYKLEEPFYFPRILRYVAVDELCRKRVESIAEIPAGRIELILNSVDLTRFHSRPQLPSKPRRALIYSNYARDSAHLPPAREACRQAGLELDVVGLSTGNAVANPETILPHYDIVFAKASCALQAMAVGNAVVLCDFPGAGPMVTSDKLDELRRMNFGAGVLTSPLTVDCIKAELARYDPADAAIVSRRIRDEAGLSDAVLRWVEMYSEVLEEFRSYRQDWHADFRALARYVTRWDYESRIDWEVQQPQNSEPPC